MDPKERRWFKLDYLCDFSRPSNFDKIGVRHTRLSLPIGANGSYHTFGSLLPSGCVDKEKAWRNLLLCTHSRQNVLTSKDQLSINSFSERLLNSPSVRTVPKPQPAAAQPKKPNES